MSNYPDPPATTDEMLARQRDAIEAAEADRPTPDPDYDPTDAERLFLTILEDEGRATTGLIRKRGGFNLSYCSEMAKRLADHGYIWRVERPNENNYGQVEPIDGLYEYNADRGDPADHE